MSSKVKCNIVIFKCRKAKDELLQLIDSAGEIHYPNRKLCEEAIEAINKILDNCKAERDTYG